jgi:hypothetical protein
MSSDAAVAIAAPTVAPTNPPDDDKRIASIRNWAPTSRGVAPSARRMPISRTRSDTLTSIMFVTPTPPMTSATPAMSPTIASMIANRLSNFSSIRQKS